jgi:hypothetical protein
MAVAGIQLKRNAAGAPSFVTIDLHKHADFIPLLEERGVEMEEPIKWTAKMKRSFAQAKNGEWEKGDTHFSFTHIASLRDGAKHGYIFLS